MWWPLLGFRPHFPRHWNPLLSLMLLIYVFSHGICSCHILFSKHCSFRYIIFRSIRNCCGFRCCCLNLNRFSWIANYISICFLQVVILFFFFSMFKVSILSWTKDSKGIWKYKTITLFIVVLCCFFALKAISCSWQIWGVFFQSIKRMLL
jgi:hypothetical protein